MHNASYTARFVSDTGASFDFGKDFGTVFDIDPLDTVDVDIGTSQGYGQMGETVETQSVKGIQREITGRIIGNVEFNKRQLLRVFAPFVSGKLYFNGQYYAEAVVKKTPAIGQIRYPEFILQLFCYNPCWLKANKNTTNIGNYTPAFRFPIRYDRHTFGIKSNDLFAVITNNGIATSNFDLVFRAVNTVVHPGIINIYSYEYLQVFDTMEYKDEIHIYRKNGRLYVEKTSAGVTQDIFSELDEESNLFILANGDNVLRMTAESGLDNLACIISFNEHFVGVFDGM